jgi:hypothetical protein
VKLLGLVRVGKCDFLIDGRNVREQAGVVGGFPQPCNHFSSAGVIQAAVNECSQALRVEFPVHDVETLRAA